MSVAAARWRRERARSPGVRGRLARAGRSLVCLGALTLGGGLVGSPAWALSADDAREQATQTLAEVQRQAGQIKTQVVGGAILDPKYLIAAAELHARTGQTDEAIALLNKIVELGRQGKADAVTVADAHAMLGESYVTSDELYSARREFEFVLEHGAEPAYAQSAPRAAARLVDVSVQLDRPELLELVLQRVEQLGPAGPSEPWAYARAKALLALGRHDEALSAARALSSSQTYDVRAAYLRGVVLMKQAQAAVPEAERAQRKPDFAAAIAEFQGAHERGHASSDEPTRTIAELSLLAVARLYFERGDNRAAAQAYERVPRTSPHFARALFELSWAYVRLGDYTRGLRTLEVLRVLEPGLIDGADSSLLLADMHLRSGRYAQAELAYQAVREKYEPLRRQVEDYLAAHPDAASNYDALTDVELSATRALPRLVFEWAREEASEDRVFAVVDDVARSRSLLRQGQRSVVLLRGALGADTRARLFPSARRELELATGLLNQLAVARLGLARAMDDEAGRGSPELENVRKERRALMTRLAQVPTRPGDFSVREAEAEKQWDTVGEKLQRCQLEVDHLNALINGLRRTLSDAERNRISIEPSALERYRSELASHEAELLEYERRIEGYQRDIDMGRVQSGFGDARFAEDERVRQRFRELFEREVALAAGGADPEAREYAGSIGPLLGQLLAAETQLTGTRQKLDTLVASLTEETVAVVEAEAEALQTYSARLDSLDEVARVLVGEVARDNLVRVHRRLQGVVLRADVGAIQKSWEKRENQRYRVRDLQRERAREETLINDELREVLDDSEETQ